jgi:hypothetical protein
MSFFSPPLAGCNVRFQKVGMGWPARAIRYPISRLLAADPFSSFFLDLVLFFAQRHRFEAVKN